MFPVEIQRFINRQRKPWNKTYATGWARYRLGYQKKEPRIPTELKEAGWMAHQGIRLQIDKLLKGLEGAKK